MTYKVMAFYCFVSVTDLPRHQAALRALADTSDICGTILIAPEGLNGTIASTGVQRALDYMNEHFELSSGQVKFSHASEIPFLRYKVRLKREIITMNQPHIDPVNNIGTYVEPENWNEIIADPEVLLLDTRNSYETKIGMFKGAIDPGTETFTELAAYVKQHLDPRNHKKIAMYCTGGIRCEKASSYMLAEGFETVYHLKGGILKYLEEIKPENSKWEGDCFVFDRRVGVEHGLAERGHTLCHGCRMPLLPEDLAAPEYEEGVTCSNCYASTDESMKERRRMRYSQMTRLVKRV
jgi:UPF0176 protein